MSANVEAMVREGINAMKAGRREEARALLMKAVEVDQYNEDAWLWLSGLVDSPEDQRTCLENVLSINPDNERARQGLQFLGINPPSPETNPFSAQPPSADPFAPPSTNTFTSVEWDMGGLETSSPSASAPRGKVEPSPTELDDWVSTLNLPTNPNATSPTTPPQTPAAPPTASPFDDVNFDLGEDEDDIFSGTVFDAATPPPPVTQQPTRRERRERGFDSLSNELDRDRDGVYGEVDAGETDVFALIPDEIAPTRLPGTHERPSAVHYVVVALLVVINIGAAVYAMMEILPA